MNTLCLTAALTMSWLAAAPPPEGELPSYAEADEGAASEAAVEEEKPEYGPFFEKEPPSDVTFPGASRREDPPLSVGHGALCFVENSNCKSALIVDADVGAGVNIISGQYGLDLPYTQFRVRGGVTIRPLSLARGTWNRWGIGLVGSWSLGSLSIVPGDSNNEIEEFRPIRAYRLAVINQLWLSQKRNALHLDLTFGAVNSSVLQFDQRYWGTHVEFGAGVGGWGQLLFSADFLDNDTRMILGFRAHGVVAGPIIGMVLLGLLAGGAAL